MKKTMSMVSPVGTIPASSKLYILLQIRLTLSTALKQLPILLENALYVNFKVFPFLPNHALSG